MLTYNGFLYTKRMELGLSRRKMAKKIGCSAFVHKMCEKGYFKPGKKLAGKISKAFDVNYDEYLHNELSYPAELPERKKMKIVQLFYKIIGSLPYLIATIVLSVLSIGYMVSGFIYSHYITVNDKLNYHEDYVSFVDRIRENGNVHISVISEMTRPEYYTYEKDASDGTSSYISIISNYDEYNYDSLSLSANYRSSTARLHYLVVPSLAEHAETGEKQLVYSITASYSIYEKAFTYTSTFMVMDDELFLDVVLIAVTNEKGNHSFLTTKDPEYETIKSVLLSHSTTFTDEFNNVLEQKDGGKIEFNNLCRYHVEGREKIDSKMLYAFFARYLGIILSGLNVFLLVYGVLYGTRKGVVKDYRPAKLEVEVDKEKPMKTDTKFVPFVPETLLEIIGIFMVFIGSLRIVLYALGFLVSSTSTVIGSDAISSLTQTFVIGMFLLYFVDFDIFLDDKRVFRNIFLYFIIFFCLYGLETLLVSEMNKESFIGQLFQMIKFPNMFGSIGCYYLIMLFLFYTPKKIQKKSTLIIYRCLTIIPVSIIFVSWLLYNGDGTLFKLGWPNAVKNLFSSEKIPFSVLAISYLLGLFFLRLFFERKYGKDRATIFFNSNRFIWIKNIMVSVIIALIALMEFLLSKNVTANKLGLGLYWNIIFLVPVLFFYHPHKGQRNIVLDWFTLFLYFFAIIFSYILTLFVVLLSI